jgi:hypothetical protein
MCYNISSLGVGRFELPRQITASERQSCHVYQFQHTPTIENQGGGSSLPANPLSNSHLNYKSRHFILSIPTFVAIIILTLATIKYNIELGGLSTSP